VVRDRVIAGADQLNRVVHEEQASGCAVRR